MGSVLPVDELNGAGVPAFPSKQQEMI